MNKVCIFGPWADALFRGKVLGGAGLQMALLAKALASRGVKVTIIDPTAKEDLHPMENLVLRAVPDWNAGLPGLRYMTHRIPNLMRCLRESGADVFYVRGLSYLQLAPLRVSRSLNARFVIALAHDTDLTGFRDRWKVHYKHNVTVRGYIGGVLPSELAIPVLLNSAHTILCQHEGQYNIGRDRGLPVVRLNNLFDTDLLDLRPEGERSHVVLVGGLAARKNLAALFPVIERLPAQSFEFIGPVLDEEGRRVEQRLRQYPNVKVHGMLDRQQTVARMASAKALVNVSLKEGFANTFLEAWVLGTPVITLHVDPGGIIREHRLGYVCDGNLDRLQELLQRDRYDLDMEKIRGYVMTNHSAQYALNVFKDMFDRTERPPRN